VLSRLAAAEHALTRDGIEEGLPPGFGGFFPSLYCSSSALVGDLLDLAIELVDRFGGGERMLPVRFEFFGKPQVLVTNPRHVQQVFKDDEHFSPSSDPAVLERFRRLLGFNLVSVDHDEWRAVRPRTAALLAGRPLAEYGEVMRRVMEEECLPSWERAAVERRPLDVFASMLEFSSKVVFRSFMRLGAAEVPDEVHPALNRLFSHIRRQVTKPSLPLWVPSAANSAFKRDRDIIRDFIAPHIDRQKAQGTMLGSIVRAHTRRAGAPPVARLSEYLASVSGGEGEPTATDRGRLAEAALRVVQAHHDATVYQLGKELARAGNDWARETKRRPTVPIGQIEATLESILCEGGEIDRELVLQEMVSNLIGGSETTILMMTWGIHLLSDAPDAMERLHREAASDRDHDVPLIDPSTLRERWGYLYNVLRETLRLAPPAAMFNRPVIADVNIDGFEIPKGTLIWGSQYITHRSPHVWKEPARFVPERFEEPVPPGAFFPFTMGPRTCIGMTYAYLEAAIGFATLARHFTVECLTKGVGRDMGLTLRPDRPVRILLRRR
jgi:cytochrome P450